MSQQTKNQHYVPQFMLRAFSNSESRVSVFDKSTGKTFVSSPRNMASENGFYDFKIDGVPGTLEPLFCDIEERAAPLMQEIVAERSLNVLSHKDRLVLAEFVGIQSLRTKANRQMLHQLEQVFETVLPSKGFAPDQIRSLVSPDEESIKMQSMYNLDIAKQLACSLAKKSWFLAAPPEATEFLISDHPVVRWNHLKPDAYMSNNGFESVGIEINVPLAPTISLSFLCRDIIRRLRNLQNSTRKFLPRLSAIKSGTPERLDIAALEHLNALQIAGATRFVFSAANDFTFASKLVDSHPEIVNPARIIAG